MQDYIVKAKDATKINRLKNYGGRLYYGIPVYQWDEWAIQGKTLKDIHEETGSQ